MPDRVIVVRESELEALREALEPFAETAEWDIADSEADSDAFRQMGPRAAVAGIVTVGHFRKAHEVRARLDAALAHPTPDGCGREGRHQWGGPQRNREVCVNCGATRTLEVPDTKGPYEARFVDGGMPSDCCEYGVISLSEGREVCRVWREQDARAIASALSAFTAGGDDG